MANPFKCMKKHLQSTMKIPHGSFHKYTKFAKLLSEGFLWENKNIWPQSEKIEPMATRVLVQCTPFSADLTSTS